MAVRKADLSKHYKTRTISDKNKWSSAKAVYIQLEISIQVPRTLKLWDQGKPHLLTKQPQHQRKWKSLLIRDWDSSKPSMIQKNERAEHVHGCLKWLVKKSKCQHNEAILSLQYCKLTSKQNENAKEWIGHLRHKASKCGFKERETRLKEQFINSIKNEEMMMEIMREVTAIKEINKVTKVNKCYVGQKEKSHKSIKGITWSNKKDQII